MTAITTEQLAEWKALAEAREVRSHTRMARKAIPALVAEVERLRADKSELNEGILELQRMLCARDGVPMPSERPLVDKLRAEVEGLRAALHKIANHEAPAGASYDMVAIARAVLPEEPADG